MIWFPLIFSVQESAMEEEPRESEFDEFDRRLKRRQTEKELD